jgi:tRNA dimethylallyltransferase
LAGDDLLIIVGPTAVGKTGLSIALAEDIGAEIVSADSMQVYRGMDIGTAKPAKEERARVPHHMIDVADPKEPFSAGEYMRMATGVIAGIRARGRTPLVVGGTGLYVRALVEGIFEGPDADMALREGLLAIERERGNGALHGMLARSDPDAAARIEPGDLRRVVRALEITMKSGRTVTELHRQHRASGRKTDAKVAGLTMARGALYARIERRVDEMMADGLLEEVARLRELGCTREMVSMQAIGYKQLMAHLDGEYALDEAVRLIKRDTRRYAKRQFTWFNRVPGIRWVELGGTGKPLDALPGLKKALDIF